MRREQAEARRASQGRQLALFELKEDSRPKPERSASGRYEAPTMLELMRVEELKMPGTKRPVATNERPDQHS